MKTFNTFKTFQGQNIFCLEGNYKTTYQIASCIKFVWPIYIKMSHLELLSDDARNNANKTLIFKNRIGRYIFQHDNDNGQR